PFGWMNSAGTSSTRSAPVVVSQTAGCSGSEALPICTQPTAVVPSTASAPLLLYRAGVSSARKATSGVVVGVGSNVATGADAVLVTSALDVGAGGVGTSALPDGALAALHAATSRA